MKQNKIVIQLFVGSESFFFLALIIGYIYYTAYSPAWQSSTHYLDITKTGIFSIFLFASSGSLLISERLRATGNRKGAIVFLSITILLGLSFLIGQCLEYYSLFSMEILPGTNIFGSAFFTLTGFHGLHVCIGLICLLLLLPFSVIKSTYPKIDGAVQAIGFYWHFVDVVWVFVFFIVYVLPYLK